MNLLEVNNICKTYGSGETAVHALKKVSFFRSKGRVCGYRRRIRLWKKYAA